MGETGDCLTRFFDDLDFPAGILDQDGRLLFANRAASGTFGEGAEPCKATLDALSSVGHWVRETGREWRGVLVVTADIQWVVRAWSVGSSRVAFLGRPAPKRPSEIARLTAVLRIEPSEARLALRIAQGLTNEVIGARFGVPVSTIKNRTCSLYRKLGIRNRVQLAALVLRSLDEGAANDTRKEEGAA